MSFVNVVYKRSHSFNWCKLIFIFIFFKLKKAVRNLGFYEKKIWNERRFTSLYVCKLLYTLVIPLYPCQLYENRAWFLYMKYNIISYISLVFRQTIQISMLVLWENETVRMSAKLKTRIFVSLFFVSKSIQIPVSECE